MGIEQTQSEAWRRGFQWADLDGEKLGCGETAESHGYDFDTPEWADFMNGAEFRQAEQIGDAFGYDYLDEDGD